MKQLHFDYYFKIGYAYKIPKCYYTIKCIPRDTAGQKVLNWKAELHPDTEYTISEDGFQNKQFIGCVDTPHDAFTFRICGEVQTGCQEYEWESDPMSAAKYRYPTKLLKPGDNLRSYFEKRKYEPEKPFLERLQADMEHLHQNFAYVKQVTDVTTSAEQAFSQGQGVCQDYAQILISLCQLSGIPARYVAGMMLGEGESHAWVEAYDGEKWIGADPTNNRFVDDNYIKLGIGRDASDCAINRGLIMGNGGEQTHDIRVCVSEI